MMTTIRELEKIKKELFQLWDSQLEFSFTIKGNKSMVDVVSENRQISKEINLNKVYINKI